jgi:ArsR family transcriptional regulator, virulence genes transcriptional regulator
MIQSMTIDDLSAAADEASEFLKSLASPVRLRILCTIADREASVGELAELLGVRQSVASQHLALLRKDGLVTTRRDGQTIWYALADQRVVRIIEVLQATFCPQPEEAVASGRASAKAAAC